MKMAPLTLPESNIVLAPTKRHTWTQHPIAKDTFWKWAEKDPVEVHPSFEFVDFEFIGSEMMLINHVYKPLLRYIKE